MVTVNNATWRTRVSNVYNVMNVRIIGILLDNGIRFFAAILHLSQGVKYFIENLITCMMLRNKYSARPMKPCDNSLPTIDLQLLAAK